MPSRQATYRLPSHARHAAVWLLLIALGGCQRGGGPEKKDDVASIPVEVASASVKPIDASYSGTATLEADREADVVAKTSGVLLKLLVEEGSVVKQGQVLARLDDAGPRLQAAKVEATLRKLEADYRRADEMFAKKLLSLEEHDKIRFDLDNHRAAYDLARLELSYTSVVAPIDGVIGKRMVKEGNLIQLNQALFHIVDLDPLLGVLNVPERELNTLKAGQPVSMVVDALPAQTFQGVIDRISPVIDSASGTFRVTSRFAADGLQPLKPGMFGRIEVVYDRKQDALTVPRAALIEEDGQAAVFVVVDAPPPAAKPDAEKEKTKGGGGDAVAAAAKPEQPAGPRLQAQRRVVGIGYSDSENVEIRDGLKAGDRVITVGRTAVRDGTLVQILESTK
ncbi:efflux RND transporter periplasmic adaptor subunit [Tahibacter amnicola]|uniref:Efflux RND transporter periplasmic adaptor subunit n=1 Tax=Tahibacter amnicola TaxID=2976241 RepID=A0ABY6BBE5_9GAMM|nr:efflux RND transporter periplasmic adaptor subunit [Tahibacter amnicola]UXI67127.1 efflux RND transporter periplasmic adaptor subunit [Tahibacter amnicola]